MSHSKKSYNRVSSMPAPPPLVGCKECLTFVRNPRVLEDRCKHTIYFEGIRKAMERRGLKRLGAGGSRAGYASKNGRWVYKVPHGHYGYEDNYWEYLCWRERAFLHTSYTTWDEKNKKYINQQHQIGHRIARCRFHSSGVLVMEKLDNSQMWYWDKELAPTLDPTLYSEPNLGSALGWIDGGQGGINREGRFQIYDYTHNTEIDDPGLSDMMAL